MVAEYDWAAGVFVGTVPASNTINASAGYRITPNFRVFAVGTNLLDEQRYQLFGGSVIGRRVLGGITATF
jgi:outer membrane receptor protein involved in Fe transport